MSKTARTRTRRIPGGGTLVVLFVAGAVVALFAVPQIVGRRSTEAQREIAEVLDPALLAATRISHMQALEMSAFQSYLMTGEISYQRRYQDAVSQERDLYRQLREFGAGLDDIQGVPEQLATLSTEMESWHLLQQPAFLSDSLREAALENLDAEQARYEEIQQRTLDLERALQAEGDKVRAETEYLQRIEGWITLGLVVLALGATTLIAVVGRNLHVLAVEAQDRRRDAVRARREIDALLEATGDGVLGMDLDGRCTSLNRAGCELLGYLESALQGRDVHDVLYHTTPDGHPRPRDGSLLLAGLANGERIRSPDVDVLWRRDNTPLSVQWSLHPMVDGTELKGAVLTFTDMTEIREKEEALRRAVRVREEVVSIVSHDLRNPLGTVAAAADLLLDLPLNEEERKKQTNIIKRSAERMSRLIGDLLDVARIEAGALVVRPALEDPRGVLEEARSIFAPQAEAKGIALEVKVEPGLPPLMLDRDRILQALSNLVGNALKVTEAGGCITMGAEVLSEGEGMSISVTDTGPGIPEDAMDRLFDRFWQASRHDRTGSGLGLAIVRGIAEAHQGSVWVYSEVGHGAAFHIVLPPSLGASNHVGGER
ncbi:MAG: PAS domain-containing protein [Gemmatimonadetes bacterium]|nr:PAS domain-containing protein [Gemmatimonadota bacterium]